MSFIIIDTETSGLPQYVDKAGKPIPADAPGQPRLAQLAMIFVADDLTEEGRLDFYVKPAGWSMTTGASAKNGLTDEFLAANGEEVEKVLNAYVKAIDEGRIVVAFNARFDLKILRGELRRAGMDDRFDRTPNICVMRAAMKLGVTKAGGGRGFPKLSDCAAHLGIQIDGAHTAGGDAVAALALFRHLHAVGGLPEAKVHYAKVPPPARTKAPSIQPDLADLASASEIPERF